ncbi:unnamed protein product [Rotaria sp. Silwood1]|nr:unnamed protein product [Rotaria sp. Silwood1]CAF1684803.1 unnamed protein product [Rotaria sp. Silwood1]CAF5023999.1 unnamed protein product [Rotaria sp. Silwood1]
MDTNSESTSTPQYETTIFTLKPNNLGPNKATLLHARIMKKSDLYKAVLYLHDYNDYFFHDHVCARFLDFGYDFFALDMRKCGRSIISREQDQYRHYFDLVLNVENIRRAAGMLSQHVTICPIEKTNNDVFLSKKPVREKAFNCMFQWLENLEREWVKNI